MKIGLVGKPSAGKSTFFKAATLMDVDIANYPFTTIAPNTGFAHVRIDCVDEELGVQCNPRTGYCIEHQRFVPFELMDVAGLVPGAHEGRGRGLAFLSDLNEADGLIHVVDCSGSVNADGEDVEAGSYDPAKDVRFLTDELDYWYLGIITKNWERFARRVQQEKQDAIKALAEQLSGLRVTEDHLKSAFSTLGLPQNVTEWKEDELHALARDLRQKTKPMVIAANKIDRPSARAHYEKLVEEFPGLTIIPCSAEVELALREAGKHGLIDYLPGDQTFTLKDDASLSDAQKKGLNYMAAFLKENGGTGVQRVLNSAVLDLLGYIAVYPGGTKKLEDSEGRVLPDCFLMAPGTTPLDFARSLHTDFAKHFIKAINVKTRLPVGKDQPLSHRDVIEIVSAK